MPETNSKRLAKNTVFMYIRMIFLTLITLYTSRIVLQKLGVEDYGIYNVVGSIVLMFNSLRSVFSSSTQRFLSYEMGKKNSDNMNIIFNMSIYVNLIIAALFVFFVEIVGLWFLNNQINVPPNRFFSAQCIFQISTLTAILSIMTTPFDAAIIAHERMDFYAYISIFEGIAKLVIVYCLSLFSYDKLILYAFFIFLVSLVVQVSNQLFCKYHFKECQIKVIWNSNYFKEMTKFAGWNFLGNTSYALSQNGINMILNVFGGPVVNAARGIAYQVNTAVHQFISNIVVVIRPYSVKAYAEGNIEKALDLLFLSAKLFFLIQLVLAIPLVYITKEVLIIWLGIIPDYAVVFIQLVLLDSLIRSISPSLDILFIASGKLKNYQLTECFLLSIPVLLSYILLKYGFSYYCVFVVVLLFELINLLVCAKIARNELSLPLKRYYISVLFPCAICFIIAIVLFVVKEIIPSNSMLIYFLIIIFAIIVCNIYMYFLGLTKTEKNYLMNLLKDKRNEHRKKRT